MARFDWRRYQMLRAPYRRRWLVLLATVTLIAIWFVQPHAGGKPPPDSPPAQMPEPEAMLSTDLVMRAAGEGRFVSLTFDDGPDPQYTPRVLDVLARHGAVATFCMVGAQALKHPDLVRQVVAAGMRLCAHSLTHDEQLKTRPAQVIEADVAGTKAVLVSAAGAAVSVEYFRAPAGNWSDELTRTAVRNGMKPLSWSVDSRDWTRPGSETILTGVRAAVRPGAVILFHDGGGQRGQTLAALESLLPWLVEQGYRFTPPA
jgi:peptidoglycan-N-acetylglucosamine deacetylase